MSTLCREVEDGLREELVRALGRHRYHLWFRDTRVLAVDGQGVTLAVPTEVHRTWLSFTYGGVLESACSALLGPGARLRLEVNEAEGERRRVREALPQRPAEWQALLERLRPAPRFEGFVAAPARRFPLLLLQQVAQGGGPGEAPVLLVGPPGSGKTHLLKALEADCQRRRPGECLYLSARGFTERWVGAVRAREVDALRAFELDLAARRLVLIDDLDDLATRPSTQAELARLLDRGPGGPRYVLALDRPPADQEPFSARLRSLLGAGVALHLAPAQGEDLDLLLRERARAYGLTLPADVGAAIVARTGSVRGAVEILDRWAAASRTLGRALGAAFLGEVAPGVALRAREEVIRRVKDAVARHFALERALLDRPTKLRQAQFPRHVAMYLVYRACALPLGELAAAFGLRSHSSVSRAIHGLRERRLADPGLEQTLDGLLTGV